YGFRSGKDLDDLFENSHIGVGNLGTFRKNIKYTSPLKSREYCSRGLPFFYTCEDEDFNSFPYVLEVDANDNPINIEQVLDFYYSVSQVEDYNVVMRQYALDNLTWGSKMRQLVRFIDKYSSV